MRGKLGLLIVSLAVLLVAAVPAWASSNNSAVSLNFPYDAYLSNDCSGEGVHVTGTLHMVLRGSTDPNGRWHYLVHENYQNVTGIGLVSGAEYQVSGSQNENLNWNFSFSGGQEAYTRISDVRLVMPGQEGNAILRTFIHVTVDANNVLVVDLDEVQLLCP
jgi:hypothetical protein